MRADWRREVAEKLAAARIDHPGAAVAWRVEPAVRIHRGAVIAGPGKLPFVLQRTIGLDVECPGPASRLRRASRQLQIRWRHCAGEPAGDIERAVVHAHGDPVADHL